jgi:oligopeptide/dipeptide ABC transporter ATP-binding protein
VPEPDPALRRERILLQGDVPSPLAPPPGCAFHPRCPYAFARCRREAPPLYDVGQGHAAACHLDDAAYGDPRGPRSLEERHAVAQSSPDR